MKFSVVFLAVFLFFSCKSSQQVFLAQKDKIERQKDRLTYWAAGYSELDELYVREKVFKQFGLEYEPIWGCQVNSSLLKSIEKHNKRVFNKLRFSADTLKHIYAISDSVYRIDTKIIEYTQQNNDLNHAISKILDTLQRGAARFSIADSGKENIYIINYNEINGNGERGKLLLSIELTIPNYSFKILLPKS